jgi:MoaA/NifB/PqqE/SkfB family radical SAM enzyme
MSILEKNNQEILVGSTKLNFNNQEKFDKAKYMLKYMKFNKAYTHSISKTELNNSEKEKILKDYKNRYQEYRNNWLNALDVKNKKKPLSIDIEIAAICDLACPHCSREFLVTPDKLINFDLYKSIIDQAVKLEVPSVKLIWRGEPLLHPKVKELIQYAKESGIIEVIINTNGTNLNEKKAHELIDSGLDQLIYSFDGGTKETYEKMRPGRFKKNKFEDVYNNIKNFSKIKKIKKSKFPITKIQMIMTKDTRNEINDFHEIFNDIVDDVTVTQYNERGGSISDLSDKIKEKLFDYFKQNNLPVSTPYLVDIDNNIFVSKKRKPCEQIYQRLMVTYSGRVGMCCHDWGASHGIGYLSEEAHQEEEDKKAVLKKIINNQKGFELLKGAKKLKNFNEPSNKIQNLREIWNGQELQKVRRKHEDFKIDEVPVCKNCTFKDTYSWEKINI